MQNTITKPKREILNYINVFRGLAILLIIAGHTLQVGDKISLINKISFEMFAGGTTLFIFISGFLFQHLSSNFEYKTYLKKKWQNVIIPYMITAIPGIILCFTIPFIYFNPFYGLNPIVQIGIFLTTGRVQNVPTWFIPMIIIFFILSYILLYLERKNILYKLLPILFAVTFFVQRHDIEPQWVWDFSYSEKYIQYLAYVITGSIHFSSMYIFGMYLSKYKEKIDIFYDKRYLLITAMIIISAIDIYLNYKYNIVNGTISKIFLTVIVLGYLKHYDEVIKSHTKINHWLDVTAKYSFGLFFIHWYYVFLFNRIFPSSIFIAVFRYIFVLFMSFITLYLIKIFLNKLKIEKTRTFIGV